MQSSRSHTGLIIFAIIGIVGICASGVAYWYMFFNVRSAIAEVSFVSEEAQLLATKNAHTQTVRRIVRDTQAQRDELASYFTNEAHIVDFLEGIERLRSQTGATLRIQSVNVGDSIDKDGLVAPLQLAIDTEGTLQEVFYTLKLLESYPLAMHVEKVRLVQDAEELTWKGDFDVVVIQSESVIEE